MLAGSAFFRGVFASPTMRRGETGWKRHRRAPGSECNGDISGFGLLNCFGWRELTSFWEMTQLASGNSRAFVPCAGGLSQNQNDLGCPMTNGSDIDKREFTGLIESLSAACPA
jgi:hypothetical protein